DPSGIATYSQVGAQFGFSISWTMLFSFPLMAAIQEISGRMGRTTGQGLASNIRRHYPAWLLNVIVSLLLSLLLDITPRLQTGRGFSRFFHRLSPCYNNGRHTVFHHRYHIVWITKYRYKVLEGALRERIRTIIKQVCEELGVQIVSGVLSREHIHMFVEIAAHCGQRFR